jgi:hypothetical protein
VHNFLQGWVQGSFTTLHKGIEKLSLLLWAKSRLRNCAKKDTFSSPWQVGYYLVELTRLSSQDNTLTSQMVNFVKLTKLHATTSQSAESCVNFSTQWQDFVQWISPWLHASGCASLNTSVSKMTLCFHLSIHDAEQIQSFVT